MSSGPILECGHGQYDVRHDCLTCLQFTVRVLNGRLQDQQIATLDCQADLRDARITIEHETELIKLVEEYQKWCEYLLDNDFANEGDRQFAWEQFGAAKEFLERCIQREAQRVFNANSNEGDASVPAATQEPAGMNTKDLHPGLGSGALREALNSRLLQWRKIHASTKGQWRTNYEEGRDNMLMDCIEGLAADVQNFDALLSLSSPIEPDISPEEIAGIRQGLADFAAGRTKPIEQIRAELRERRLLENADVLATFQKYIPRLCGEIGLQTISQITGALNEALAPSRQGAAKRVEG